MSDDDDAFDRAFLLAEQGDHRGAIAAFEGRQDLSALERFTRGNSYRELGDLGAARDDLRAAARGGVWEAWFNLALTQNDLGQEARALRSGRMGAAYGDPGAIAYCAVDAWDRGRHEESFVLAERLTNVPTSLSRGCLGHFRLLRFQKRGGKGPIPGALVDLLAAGADFPWAPEDLERRRPWRVGKVGFPAGRVMSARPKAVAIEPLRVDLPESRKGRPSNAAILRAAALGAQPAVTELVERLRMRSREAEAEALDERVTELREGLESPQTDFLPAASSYPPA